MMSMLNVVDNSGVKLIRVISVHKPYHKGGVVGKMVTASVREARPDAKARKGDVVRALIVRTRRDIRRSDGRVLAFADNAAVMLTPDLKPMGTRVFGPLPIELRTQQWLKVLSLAPQTV